MKNPRTKLAFSLLAIAAAAAVFWFSSQRADAPQEKLAQNQEKKQSTILQEKNRTTQSEKEGEVAQKEKEKPAKSQPTKTLREQARDLEITLTPEGEIDTSNWQTYRNRSCGIEFKIPPGWEANTFILLSENSDDCSAFTDEQINNSEIKRIGVYLPLSLRLKYDPDFEEEKNPFTNFSIIFLPYRNLPESKHPKMLTVRGDDIFAPDILAYGNSEESFEPDDFFILRKDGSQTWKYWVAPSPSNFKPLPFDNHQEILKKIYYAVLKTVKILPADIQTQKKQKSQWSVYRDGQIGFSIKYPSSFKVTDWNNKGKAFDEGRYLISLEVQKTPWPTFSERYEKEKKWQEKIKSTPKEKIGPGHILRKLPKKEDLLLWGKIKAEKIIAQSPVGVDITDWVVVQFRHKDNYYRLTLFAGNNGYPDEAEDVFQTMLESLEFAN